MGIHDRDYIRNRPRGGGGIGMGMRGGPWTMTTILIVINVAVYLLDWMLYSAGVTANMLSTTQLTAPGVTGGQVGYQIIAEKPLFALGHFSTYTAFSQLQFWRFCTFQFLHGNSTHLLLNMIGLYFFGPAVERFLESRKRFLAFYLTCGIFGGFLYLILNLVGNLTNSDIPGLLFAPPTTPLIGASAGVFGVVVASAFVSKDAVMYVFMVLPMKIRTGAYLMVAIAAANLFIIQGSNQGGDAAHLGGAAAGFFFIRRHHLLHDFFDILGPSKKRKGGKSRSPRRGKSKPAVDDATLNRILDKVRDHGMHSLTDKEKNLLEKASKDKRV
jgi:membrane associated rhomboid family serine protease